MLFGKKNCSHCGSNYDVVDATCPTCHERDENFDTLGIPKNIIWLPVYKQLILFAVGLVGLNVAGIFMELILMAIGATATGADYVRLSVNRSEGDHHVARHGNKASR